MSTPQPAPPSPVRGRFVVLDPSRPPCPACGQPAASMFYDAHGRLARLVGYLIAKGKRWNLDEEQAGSISLGFDAQGMIRCSRQMNELAEREVPQG